MKTSMLVLRQTEEKTLVSSGDHYSADNIIKSNFTAIRLRSQLRNRPPMEEDLLEIAVSKACA